MRGMDNAGKTALFCHLTQADTYRMFPIQTDAYREAAAAVYVVDVSDRERMHNVRENLEDILRDDTYENEPKTLLILANKQIFLVACHHRGF
ncbi:hypothetical protein BGZ93_000249 [Podila epicladia]|nr:hypothetical protein BGZ92_000952 [Podila epicladia]KAG0086197.1 hypothetical protein BGZ93_000249 [Podila epicladia]